MPAAPAEPAQLVTMPDGGQRVQSREERAAAAIMAKRSKAKEAPPPEAPPAAEAAPEPPKAVEPPPAPAKDDAAMREARMLAQLQAKEREAYETKRRADELTAKLKEREDRDAKYKANPIDALKDLGYTYEDLTKGIVGGKFEPASAEQLAIEGTRSEVEQLKAKLAELEQERNQAAQQAALVQRAQELEGVLKRDDVADKIPYLSAMPWAARHIAEYAIKNPEADVDSYAVELDAQLARESSAFTSDRVLKKLLADEATKARVMALLGITKQADQASPASGNGPGRGNGPSAIPASAAADPGTRKTPSRAVTAAERQANAVAAVMRKRAAGG